MTYQIRKKNQLSTAFIYYVVLVVGIVFDRMSLRVMPVGPNGSIIPGANIELVKIPLETRNANASTCILFKF